MLYPTPIAKLIESYSKLPGIGIKTATRLAFYTIGTAAPSPMVLPVVKPLVPYTT